MYLLKLFSIDEAVRRVSQLLSHVLWEVLFPSSEQLRGLGRSTIKGSAANTNVRQPKRKVNKIPPHVDGVEYGSKE